MKIKKCVLVVGICALLVGCGSNSSTTTPEVTSSPETTPKVEEFDSEAVALHRSNLDITKHTVEFAVRSKNKIIKLSLDENSPYTFTPDSYLKVTADNYAVLIQEDETTVGVLHFGDSDTLDISIADAFKYKGKQVFFEGGNLASETFEEVTSEKTVESENSEVVINKWGTIDGKLEGYGQLYFSISNEETLKKIMDSLSYSLSEKKYLDNETELTLFLVAGGTISFSLVKGKGWYFDKLSAAEQDTAQSFVICKGGKLWLTASYFDDNHILISEESEDWKYEKDKMTFIGKYMQVTDTDNYDYDDDEDVHTYAQLVISDIQVDGVSVYRGQLVLNVSDIKDVTTCFDLITFSYAAG